MTDPFTREQFDDLGRAVMEAAPRFMKQVPLNNGCTIRANRGLIYSSITVRDENKKLTWEMSYYIDVPEGIEKLSGEIVSKFSGHFEYMGDRSRIVPDITLFKCMY